MFGQSGKILVHHIDQAFSRAVPAVANLIGNADDCHRFDLINLAAFNFVNMSCRHREFAPSVGTFGNSGHAFDLQRIRFAVVIEHGIGHDQSHFFIHGEQAPLIDIGDVPHDSGAELRSALHPTEHCYASGSLLCVRWKRVLIICRGGAVFAPLAFVGEWRSIAVALLDRLIIAIRGFQHLLARNSLGSGDLCDQDQLAV